METFVQHFFEVFKSLSNTSQKLFYKIFKVPEEA